MVGSIIYITCHNLICFYFSNIYRTHYFVCLHNYSITKHYIAHNLNQLAFIAHKQIQNTVHLFTTTLLSSCPRSKQDGYKGV